MILEDGNHQYRSGLLIKIGLILRSERRFLLTDCIDPRRPNRRMLSLSSRTPRQELIDLEWMPQGVGDVHFLDSSEAVFDKESIRFPSARGIAVVCLRKQSRVVGVDKKG